MAECPSGRYLSEIVTAGGLTIKHPLETSETTLGVPHSLLDWSGSENDYAQWDALAVTLIGRLELSWMKLKTWPSTARMPLDEYETYETPMNSVRERYARLRKPWTNTSSAVGTLGYTWGITLPDMAWDSSDEVAQLVQIIIDAQCLRERVDEAYRLAGGNPTTPGDTGHTPSGGGLGIVGTTILVVAGAGITAGLVLAARKWGST